MQNSSHIDSVEMLHRPLLHAPRAGRDEPARCLQDPGSRPFQASCTHAAGRIALAAGTLRLVLRAADQRARCRRKDTPSPCLHAHMGGASLARDEARDDLKTPEMGGADADADALLRAPAARPPAARGDLSTPSGERTSAAQAWAHPRPPSPACRDCGTPER